MPSQGHAVRNDAVISNQTIVGHMDVGHDKTVLTNSGLHAIRRSAIDGHIFPQCRVITHMGQGIFTVVFEILRNGRNDDSWEDAEGWDGDDDGWIDDEDSTKTTVKTIVEEIED